MAALNWKGNPHTQTEEKLKARKKGELRFYPGGGGGGGGGRGRGARCQMARSLPSPDMNRE